MKYNQLDRIVRVTPGESILAERTLRADEDYLRDHFPRFPVMPGVMMLESLHQAAHWLVRVTDEFTHPLVLLRTVKSVKFGDFLAPNQTLRITAEITKSDGETYKIKAAATKDDRPTVTARLVLQTTLTGDAPEIGTDAAVARETRRQYERLFAG